MGLKFSTVLSIVFHTSLAYRQRHGKPAYRWIDLTYALNNNTVMFPGRKLILGTEFEGEKADGSWLASKGFCMSEHTSTHIDAPYHFQKNGQTVSEIPLEDLLDIPGMVIDIYDKVHKFDNNGRLTVISNYVLTRQDILEWEAKNGMIPGGSVVLVRTGWAQRWPIVADYLGIKPEDWNATVFDGIADATKPYPFRIDFEAAKLLNFPGFDASAAQFLSTERHVNGVGIDTMSLDAGNSHAHPAHKIFTKNNVYMLENVANLHLLPCRGFRLFAVPFSVYKGTASPTRLLAKLSVPQILPQL